MVVETLIVGGGVAGLSTGLHLAREGHETAILEAGLQYGLATRASAGIVSAQLVRNTPRSVLRRLGRDVGTRLLEAVAASASSVFDLVREEDLACDASQSGFIAPFSRHTEQWKETVDAWSSLRSDVTLLDRDDTASLTGCVGYAGAILDRSGGALDPAAYADSLATTASRYGARLFCDTTALHITPARTGATRWAVTHERGVVYARNVVLAANGANAGFHPRLRHLVVPLSVLEVATEPLSAGMRARVLPKGHVLTDLSTDVFSIRYDAHGRLITAAPALGAAAERSAIDAHVNARFADMIPGWEPTPISFGWVGTAWLFGDCIPRLPLLDEGLMAIQTCNGRGLAMSTLAGIEAARMILSDGRVPPRLPTNLPRALPAFSFARHIPNLVMTGARFMARHGAKR